MARKTTALIVTLAIAVNGSAQTADRITPPDVPVDIQVAASYKLFFKAHAVGTQNFVCAPTPTLSGFEWLFVGPQATGFDADVQQVLTHFQSRNPQWNNDLHAIWQHSRDSSVVWAKKLAGSTDPNYVAPDAIEWLLLEVTGSDPREVTSYRRPSESSE
jgi:hypothetical protein